MGTGDSGEILEVSPEIYSSSMRSPQTRMRSLEKEIGTCIIFKVSEMIQLKRLKNDREASVILGSLRLNQKEQYMSNQLNA